MGTRSTAPRRGARIPKARIREEVIETSTEENVRKLKEVIDAFNSKDFSRLEKLNARSIVFDAAGLPEPLKGREAVSEWNRAFTDAFPDLRFRLERSFGEGDWVCGEGIGTGTHRGPLPGPDGQTIPATNKTIRLKFAATQKLEGGEVTEVHVYFDRLEMVTQLGIKP